jgi:hypothetical protein
MQHRDLDQLVDDMRQAVAPEALFAQDGIHKVGLSDLLDARDFPALIEEYACESALKDLPPPRVKVESYRAFEWSGALHVFVAAKGGRLVGFRRRCWARPSSWCARRPAAASTFSCRAAAMPRPTAST